MSQTFRTYAVIVAQVTALVLGLDLAVFYLRLGWFLLLVWFGGAILALMVTRSRWKDARRSLLAAVSVVGIYVGITWVAWEALTEQRSHAVFTMKWADQGDKNDFREAEVVLEFATHPGHYVGIYSTQLRDYLQRQGNATIEVAFEVTRDFGCMRGFHEVRVGGLTSWESARVIVVLLGILHLRGVATRGGAHDPQCPEQNMQ